jgi:predicted secreted protein
MRAMTRRVKIMIAWIVAVALVMCCVACTPPVEQPPTGDSDDLTIQTLTRPLEAGGVLNEFELGEMPQMILDENPTTGFVWFFSVTGDDVVMLISDDYFSDPSYTGLVGTGGQRFITLLAFAPGEAVVEMILKRAGDDSASETVTYRVSVKGADSGNSQSGATSENDDLSERLARCRQLTDGMVMKVRPGQILRVTLDENQSIPYRWIPEFSDDSLIALILEETDSAYATSNMPGAGGQKHLFYFEALSAGSCTITMNLTHVAESGDIDLTESYTIIIEEK